MSNNNLKVSIFSTKESIGGAGIAAKRLFESLTGQGKNEIKMIVGYKISKDEKVIEINAFSKYLMKFYSRFESYVLKLQKTENKIHHSLGLTGVINSSYINSLNSDIINLHWINSGFISINTISKINKTIVLTIHDSWIFLGTEHHPNGELDLRYISGYNKKNRDNNYSLIDLDRFIWSIKNKKLSSNINFIAPSLWIYNKLKNSLIFKNSNITHIPNALNTNIFKPLDKMESRSKLNLDYADKIILFGVFGDAFTINNKGIDLLIKSLENLKNKNYLCLCVGHQSKSIEIGKLKIIFLGHISENEKMAIAYNSSDVVVIPSRMENLTQMGTEALSCGKPVVAFDIGGNSDIIEDNSTGFLVEPFNTLEFSRKINKVLNLDALKSAEMSFRCRQKAILNWSYPVVSEKYNNFFEKISKK